MDGTTARASVRTSHGHQLSSKHCVCSPWPEPLSLAALHRFSNAWSCAALSAAPLPSSPAHGVRLLPHASVGFVDDPIPRTICPRPSSMMKTMTTQTSSLPCVPHAAALRNLQFFAITAPLLWDLHKISGQRRGNTKSQDSLEMQSNNEGYGISETTTERMRDPRLLRVSRGSVRAVKWSEI